MLSIRGGNPFLGFWPFIGNRDQIHPRIAPSNWRMGKLTVMIISDHIGDLLESGREAYVSTTRANWTQLRKRFSNTIITTILRLQLGFPGLILRVRYALSWNITVIWTDNVNSSWPLFSSFTMRLLLREYLTNSWRSRLLVEMCQQVHSPIMFKVRVLRTTIMVIG